MAWTAIFDPIFGPLLQFGALVTVIVLSFVLSLFITLAQKYLTNQQKMKTVKEETKKLQKEMKAHKGDQDKMMKLQKQIMEKNKDIMMESFKPLLITFIPLILIFGWLQGNLSWEPLAPGEEFVVEVLGKGVVEVELLETEGMEILSDAKQTLALKVEEGWIFDKTNYVGRWNLKGEEGDYTLQFKTPTGAFTKDIIITTGRAYETTLEKVRTVPEITSVESKHTKIIVIPGINWGWLGGYIIFSLLFSIALRKLLKVY